MEQIILLYNLFQFVSKLLENHTDQHRGNEMLRTYVMFMYMGIAESLVCFDVNINMRESFKKFKLF